MLTELLVLDIETVPQAPSFADMDLSWQELFCDKVAKTVPDAMGWEEIYRKKAGILAEFGKIVCISIAYFYQNENHSLALKVKSIYGEDEVEILRSFTDLCDKMYHVNRTFQFAGHNIKEFDIPYICRRLLVNKLPLPAYLQLHDKKPWEVKMFDTLNWWKFGDNKNYISLHLLANVLGLPSSKSDLDGSKVQNVYFQEKNLPRIATYCEQDVILTANIILRFLDKEPLNESNILKKSLETGV